MLLIIDVGKKGSEGVEVFGSVWIIFVMMALCAAYGCSHPDCGYIADAICLVDGAIFGLL